MRTIIGFIDTNEITKIHDLSNSRIVASCQGFDKEDIESAFIGQLSCDRFTFFDLEDYIQINDLTQIGEFQIASKDFNNIIFKSEDKIDDQSFILKWSLYLELKKLMNYEKNLNNTDLENESE